MSRAGQDMMRREEKTYDLRIRTHGRKGACCKTHSRPPQRDCIGSRKKGWTRVRSQSFKSQPSPLKARTKAATLRMAVVDPALPKGVAYGGDKPAPLRQRKNCFEARSRYVNQFIGVRNDMC
jgi:hypothetical protein